MINLLQSHRREDYEDLTIGNMMWHVLLFYRPQKDINISLVQRRAYLLCERGVSVKHQNAGAAIGPSAAD
jgi:hypothetical protein